MDIPQWVKELVFAVVFVWFVDWEIRKVKKWVEERPPPLALRHDTGEAILRIDSDGMD